MVHSIAIILPLKLKNSRQQNSSLQNKKKMLCTLYIPVILKIQRIEGNRVDPDKGAQDELSHLDLPWLKMQ